MLLGVKLTIINQKFIFLIAKIKFTCTLVFTILKSVPLRKVENLQNNF